MDIADKIIEILFFILGAVVGSFLNVCIYRIPEKKSIVFPRSFCPSCGKQIRFYENIPVISYFLLKGRCSQCNEKISMRYPLVEFITALLYFLLYRKYGCTVEFFVSIFFVSLLIVISFIDFDLKIIPDVLSLGGLIFGFVLAFFRPSFGYVDSLLGIFIGGGILFAIAYGYQFFAKREGMGGGDIKLLGMIGAFYGIKGVIFSLTTGSLMGCIIGIPLMINKGEDTRYAIPFGPFLSLGALLFVFTGDKIVNEFAHFITGS